jgi:hypothetical protein
MGLETEALLSIPSGTDNEDRGGAVPALAWVIDGATDVVREPLTHWASDAAWFAAAMHGMLESLAVSPPPSLAELPLLVAADLAPRFAAEARRMPTDAHEHPSAAALVIRETLPGTIEYVSLGDCVLLADTGKQFVRIGIDEQDAGDAWVAATLKTLERPSREQLWPQLRLQRARMNSPDGYGIFSITPAPPHFIRHGFLALPAGTRILLATDGVTRLADVFRRYDAASLFEKAWSAGLAPLFEELRAIEAADSACTAYPRAKTSDDATAILLRVT